MKTDINNKQVYALREWGPYLAGYLWPDGCPDVFTIIATFDDEQQAIACGKHYDLIGLNGACNHVVEPYSMPWSEEYRRPPHNLDFKVPYGKQLVSVAQQAIDIINNSDLKDPETFVQMLNNALEVLGLDNEMIASRLKVSSTMVARWREGWNLPACNLRPQVLFSLKCLLKKQQEELTAYWNRVNSRLRA